MEKENTDKFKYFLECYFVPSMAYDDVLDLVVEFKNSESKETINKLCAELNEVINYNKWEQMQDLILASGMRKYDHKRTQELVRLILQALI